MSAEQIAEITSGVEKTEISEHSIKEYKIGTIKVPSGIYKDERVRDKATSYIELFGKKPLNEIASSLKIHGVTKLKKEALATSIIKHIFDKVTYIDGEDKYTETDVNNVLICVLNMFNKDDIIAIIKKKKIDGYSKLNKVQLMKLFIEKITIPTKKE